MSKDSEQNGDSHDLNVRTEILRRHPSQGDDSVTGVSHHLIVFF